MGKYINNSTGSDVSIYMSRNWDIKAVGGTFLVSFNKSCGLPDCTIQEGNHNIIMNKKQLIKFADRLNAVVAAFEKTDSSDKLLIKALECDDNQKYSGVIHDLNRIIESCNSYLKSIQDIIYRLENPNDKSDIWIDKLDDTQRKHQINLLKNSKLQCFELKEQTLSNIDKYKGD